MARPRLGLISIDVDTFQDYANLYGIPTFGNQVYDYSLPRLLELFSLYNIKATFFIIGRDALHNRNKNLIRQMADSGHEIASHSMNHVHAFSRLPCRTKFQEISESKKVLEDLTGRKISGFRAPSYDIDKEGMRMLSECGYSYDSSIVPSVFLGCFRLLGFVKTGRWIPGFGKFYSYFTPRTPYILEEGRLMEVPVGIAPYLYFPFCGTPMLLGGTKLFDMFYDITRHTDSYFHYQMHGIELNDIHKDGIDSVFSRQPGISIGLEKKLKLYHHILKRVTADYNFGPIRDIF